MFNVLSSVQINFCHLIRPITPISKTGNKQKIVKKTLNSLQKLSKIF